MVMSYGFNRDMGYNIMNTDVEKLYRRSVEALSQNREHYIHTVMYYRTDGRSRRLAWLCLMGLIETSDMV